MKKLSKNQRIVLVFFVAIVIIGVVFATVFIMKYDNESKAVIRIMPLGDSITLGGIPNAPTVGYRQKLFLDLENAGFNIDFVGNQSNGEPNFDSDHEGHSGWTSNQIKRNVYKWLKLNPADIVLLHIGTNDISRGQQNVSEVEGILNEIDRFEADYRKSILVIVALIILRMDTYARNETTKAFNDQVENMVYQRIEYGDRLALVDMENALIYPDDMRDSKHPNAVGYNKMADVWFKVIVSKI